MRSRVEGQSNGKKNGGIEKREEEWRDRETGRGMEG
jgi:hypothetical protein